MSTLLTVAEAAAELRVGRMSVYRLIWSGELTPTDISQGGRPKLRVERAVLDAWIRARRGAARPAVAS